MFSFCFVSVLDSLNAKESHRAVKRISTHGFPSMWQYSES